MIKESVNKLWSILGKFFLLKIDFRKIILLSQYLLVYLGIQMYKIWYILFMLEKLKRV